LRTSASARRSRGTALYVGCRPAEAGADMIPVIRWSRRHGKRAAAGVRGPMSEAPPRAKRPDYGIDAPGVVRNLAVGGAAALVLAAAAFPLGWAPLARMATGAAIGCLFGAGWMVWGSKVEKVRERGRLLDSLPWRGARRCSTSAAAAACSWSAPPGA